MNNIELQNLKKQYADNIKNGLDSVTAVNWGSRASQEARFKIFLDIYRQYPPTSTILDVGCGLGGLYKFFIDHKLNPNYTGMDICPEMITALKNTYPQVTGFTCNLLENHIQNKSWDIVVSSGIFNQVGSDDDNYTRKMIKAMWQLCNKSVAWNMLSTNADPSGIATTTRLSDPNKWVKFAKSLSKHVELRHDYLKHDFTIIIRR